LQFGLKLSFLGFVPGSPLQQSSTMNNFGNNLQHGLLSVTCPEQPSPTQTLFQPASNRSVTFNVTAQLLWRKLSPNVVARRAVIKHSGFNLAILDAIFALGFGTIIHRFDKMRVS
jgi:hypothetical protein